MRVLPSRCRGTGSGQRLAAGKPARYRLKITKSSQRATTTSTLARRWERWWRWAAAEAGGSGYAAEYSRRAVGGSSTPRTALFSISKSPLCAEKKYMLSVERAAVVARTHNLPLIVDTGGGREDLQCYCTAWAQISLSIAARKRLKEPTSGHSDWQNAVC